MIGIHLLADFHDITTERLVDAGLLADCLLKAAMRGGLTPIGPPVLHRFDGGGLDRLLAAVRVAHGDFTPIRNTATSPWTSSRAAHPTPTPLSRSFATPSTRPASG